MEEDRIMNSKVSLVHRLESNRRNGMAVSMTDEDWEELESFLDKVCQGFTSSLRSRHPDLKERNFRLCMLLRLGLSNQELKHFYGIELESVKHKLLMLKRKLGIESLSISARAYIRQSYHFR